MFFSSPQFRDLQQSRSEILRRCKASTIGESTRLSATEISKIYCDCVVLAIGIVISGHLRSDEMKNSVDSYCCADRESYTKHRSCRSITWLQKWRVTAAAVATVNFRTCSAIGLPAYRPTGLAEERTESIDCVAENGRKALSKRAELLVMGRKWKCTAVYWRPEMALMFLN